MLFDNKIVWVTGGGSGIGEAMAMEFSAIWKSTWPS
jgi:NAD(P)-dependent dehydrogenase (short-subunit alcohol dehydrogenase family)